MSLTYILLAMICVSRFAKDGKLLSTLTLFNHCRHDVTGSVGSRARPAWIASQVFVFVQNLFGRFMAKKCVDKISRSRDLLAKSTPKTFNPPQKRLKKQTFTKSNPKHIKTKATYYWAETRFLEFFCLLLNGLPAIT